MRAGSLGPPGPPLPGLGILLSSAQPALPLSGVFVTAWVATRSCLWDTDAATSCWAVTLGLPARLCFPPGAAICPHCWEKEWGPQDRH